MDTLILNDMMSNFNINEIKKFSDLECYIDKIFKALACDSLKAILESIDVKIREERDHKKYRYVNKQKKTIITAMGLVTFSRVYYKYIDEHGGSHYVYLLDEILDLELIGTTSTNLIEKMIETAVNDSYRESAEDLRIKLNCEISHQTIWNKVQKTGELIKEQEKARVKKHLDYNLDGKKEIKVIFVEKDGIFVKSQDKKKEDMEIKLAKVYEGFEKLSTKKSRYKTIDVMYAAGCESPEDFDCIINSKIAEKYKDETIQFKIINGDGAGWITREKDDDKRTVVQLDWFHVKRAIKRNVKDLEKRVEIRQLINNKKYDEAISIIKAYAEIEIDEKEKKKLEDLYRYFHNNRDALERYTDRTDIKLPKGMKYRGMGTMESSMHNVLAGRMKHNGTSWSKNGAESMAKLLALKHEGRLEEVLRNLYKDMEVPQIKESISEMLKQKYNEAESAIKQALKGSKKKSKVYKCKKTHIECENYKKIVLQSVLKSLFEIKPFSHLIYR